MTSDLPRYQIVLGSVLAIIAGITTLAVLIPELAVFMVVIIAGIAVISGFVALLWLIMEAVYD